MKLIKAFAGISVFASYVLLSNWEIGNIGNWAMIFVYLIAFFWLAIVILAKKEARRCGNTKRAKNKNVHFHYKWRSLKSQEVEA